MIEKGTIVKKNNIHNTKNIYENDDTCDDAYDILDDTNSSCFVSVDNISNSFSDTHSNLENFNIITENHDNISCNTVISEDCENKIVTNGNDNETETETETDNESNNVSEIFRLNYENRFDDNDDTIIEMINPLVNSNNTDNLYNKLNTGDIILCHSSSEDSLVDKEIEYFTHSPWEHTAIIIKNPSWIDEKLKDDIYVFQSNPGPNIYSDIINGNSSGVTINLLSDFLSNRKSIYVRSFKNFQLTDESMHLFKKTFLSAHGKPYDKNIIHWTITGLGTFFRCPCISKKIITREDNKFWCSSLVYFVYTKMKWTNKNTDWTCKVPNDILSIELLPPYTLTNIWKLK